MFSALPPDSAIPSRDGGIVIPVDPDTTGDAFRPVSPLGVRHVMDERDDALARVHYVRRVLGGRVRNPFYSLPSNPINRRATSSNGSSTSNRRAHPSGISPTPFQARKSDRRSRPFADGGWPCRPPSADTSSPTCGPAAAPCTSGAAGAPFACPQSLGWYTFVSQRG